MDAIKLLSDHIDIHKLMEHYGFDRIKPYGSTLIRSCCKLHGGNNPTAFVANIEDGRWYCHTGDCGGGDAYTLVQRMEKIGFVESVRWVADFFGIDIDTLEITERNDEYKKELKEWIGAMKARRITEAAEYVLSDEVRPVAKFRTFKPETLDFFQLGFVREVQVTSKSGTTFPLRDRLVFPIYFKGKLIGASYRSTKADQVPKWLHQPANIETKNILYNYDNVLGELEIAVVEGIPDVWAFYEIGVPAVATFGAHITDEQYKLLMRTGADLVDAFDGDEPGRRAGEKLLELFENKAAVSVLAFGEKDDPESIERNQLTKLFEQRERKV